MALKDKWIDKIDGVDDVLSEHINDVAHAVIELEEKQKSEAEPDSVAVRGSSGQLKVATPIKNDDSVNLKFFKENASNALIGEKVGSTITLDDISPAEHDIKATASSKNICDNVFESGGITSDTGVDGVNKTTVRSVNYIPIKPNTTYTIKAYNFTGNIRFRFYAENKVYIGYKFSNVPNGNAFTFKTSSDSYFVRFDILETNTDILLQLEEGAVATTYTPYVDVSKTKAKVYGEGSSYIEHPIAVDGTIEGLKSLYPTVSIVSDTEGVVFYAKYNRDINKAFAELRQAIISLGGNV